MNRSRFAASVAALLSLAACYSPDWTVLEDHVITADENGQGG